MSDDEEGILGVDDEFGLDSDDAENVGDEKQMLNLDGGDSSDESESGDDDMQNQPASSNEGEQEFPDPNKPHVQKVENQPFDEAVEINDSEELDSEESG
jgi:intraflagellar transport protein 46